MCERLEVITEMSSYSVTYEKVRNLLDDIETIFKKKGVSFTEFRK
jgi:hypothetical protein